jgi:3-hydroxyacyl-CoA dehydrogenase
VSDPAPGAEKALASYLMSIWPTLEEVGLADGASPSNYRFVGASLEKYYDVVDFIQEVSYCAVTDPSLY